MSDVNQFNITEAVKDSFKTEPGSRFEQLLHGLIEHLHDYTREMNITHDEWMKVLTFLYDCGKISTPERQEFILLSDVLGFSALVDMLNTRGGATEGSNLGPFYLDDAANMPLGCDIAGDRSGAIVLVHGKVTDILHHPLSGAVIDTWQADASGTYPIQEQEHGQDKYDLRAKLKTDSEGRYYYTTVLPKPYTVPYDGPVGELLRAGNRHAWRAAHLHYIIRHPGMHTVTTEVFFENTEYLGNDAVFGVRKSLIGKVVPASKVDLSSFDLARKPDAVIEYDFVMAPDNNA
ncbi:dioxygenase family protein [Thalassospira sp. SM2505]|uniref:dioxygenase family protein n=1 Tax=Thalassospira sp. CH_XMU1448-2 TaxID=3107773 RepID=UPI0030086F37